VKLISIRQPGYFPYLGFFKKIESADVFVFLDDVQYTRSDWDNRNKIETTDGPMWLTIPILNKSKEFLNEVKIDHTQNWIYKHKSAIKFSYQNTPFFDLYWKDIESILDKKYTKLIDLNMKLINYFKSVLDINTETVFSSDLKINSNGSEKLCQICMKLKADTYLSGELGQNYLDLKLFENNQIKIIFEEFKHPTYSQMNSKFLPNMSIIDLLFNEGDNSINILKKCRNY
jgi:hypothetical protein